MSIEVITKIEITATIAFNEGELCALDALTGYGIKPFLDVFYNKLGRAYMEPYEGNLRALFIKINQTVPEAMKRVKKAREILSSKEPT